MIEFVIAGRRVGPGHKPLIITEIGINHEGDFDKAVKLVDAVIGAGAPILELLDIGEQDTRAESLRDGPLFDLVRRDRLIELLDHESLSNSDSKFLFYVINVKMFLETFS